MTNRQQRRRADVRSWGIPIAFTALGAYAWACVDDPDLSGSDSTGDVEPSGSSASGSGSATSASSTAGTTTETTTADPTTTSPGTGDPDVTRADVLASIAYQVMVPTTAEFAGVATDLHTAAAAWAAAVDADPLGAEVELGAARDAFAAAATVWQRLEVMQIGPAADSVAGIAGENIRDQVYSWPTVDTCAVDRQIADAGYAEADFFLTELVYAYGLDALEYLLHVHDQNHHCEGTTGAQLDAPWAALGFEEIQRRRGAYAARVAEEIARQADVLATGWSPEGDDFAAALANPGGGSPYESEMAAIDDVFRAMFYLDKETKDAKLGVPLGLFEGCAAPPCANLLESQWALPDLSGPAIAENLRGVRHLVWGGPDAASDGFDDLLVGAGCADVAVDLLDALGTAIADAESIDGALEQVIVTDTARVEQLRTEVKAATDILKGPFVMCLMLTIPAEGAGDAD